MLIVKSLVSLPLALLFLHVAAEAEPEALPAPQRGTGWGSQNSGNQGGNGWGNQNGGNQGGNPWAQQQQPSGWGPPQQQQQGGWGPPQQQQPTGWGPPPATPAQGSWGQSWQPQQTPRPNDGGQQGGNPRPTQAPQPRPADDDDEPRWTAPPAWGPRGSKPFGPKSSTPVVQSSSGHRRTTSHGDPRTISYNSDQIPTTTADLPKEPVPFVAKCGKRRYDEYAISNALIAGCFYIKKGNKAGSDFPKVFTNSQRFDFGDIKGTLYEFPLIEDAAFISGDPGMDRVIFTYPDCFLGGELTSEGQQAGRYTECSEEY